MDSDWKRQLDALHTDLVQRDDPAAWVREADAVDASERYPHVAVRGPVFGIAAREPAAGAEWRVVHPVTDGTPQQARDALNSHLWFRAKDGTDDPGVRHELLAAVALLEREPVNELEVLGVRYRVVRGDEFARSGDDGLAPPRPTDREPAVADWDSADATPSPDKGYVLAPPPQESITAGALRLALQDFTYSAAGVPPAMRADSRRAATAYPDVVLLPAGFGAVQRGKHGWQPFGALMPTPHEARRLLYDALLTLWPMIRDLTEGEKKRYAKIAEAYKAAGRANELRVDDEVFRICRIERMVRRRPDGPEPPRRSDPDPYEPVRIHPAMDDDGTLHCE